MPLPNTDHIIFHPRKRNTILCSNCWGEFPLPLPFSTTMLKAIMDQFTKEHLGCPKTREMPPDHAYDPEVPMQQRVATWLANGERGISSETMLSVIAGVHVDGLWDAHPYDPDDFRRCHQLLQLVPELREGFHKLAATSTAWKNLLDHWDELTAMLEDQQRTGKANGMYERMRELIERP